MSLPRLSLQVLEAFEHVARSGSMQAAALEMGLSISSVSHYVARLEAELGADLIDRSSRPFSLTAEGREALYHLSSGLRHLRRATSETAVGGLLGTRSLRIGLIEDFESGVTPDLAVILARRMPHATLAISNVLSHEAPDLVRRGKLDLAIAADSADRPRNIRVVPLVRDPFVLAMPAGSAAEASDVVHGQSGLPLLRFNREHQIGRQIEAHLARNRIAPPDRFAFDSAQSILAVVASGNGWAIVTPLGLLRAKRHAARVRLYPLPVPAFARRIALFARDGFDPRIMDAVVMLLRQSIGQTAVDPAVAEYPWLRGLFALLDARPNDHRESEDAG